MLTTAAIAMLIGLIALLGIVCGVALSYRREAEEQRERADRLEMSLDAQDGRISALNERIAALQHKLEGDC